MNVSPAWTDAADQRRHIGRAVEHHTSIGSTNDRARELLASPDGEGVAVVADRQTSGRGRRGRTWISPPGVNLMVSVALRPRVQPSLASLLGLSVALALRSACAQLAPEAGIAIRWPNDLVDRAGRKLAGILIETALSEGRLTEAVIGMGINANWRQPDMPPEIAAAATSLVELASRSVDRPLLLARLLDALDREVGALERGQSPVARAQDASWLNGRDVDLDLGERVLTGRVAGLGDDGSLLLDTAEGRVALTTGEVLRVRDRSLSEVPA